MTVEELINSLIQHKNHSKAVSMENYMRNQFSFLGIQSKERRSISEPFFASEKRKEGIDWDLIYFLWSQPYREYSYIACDYLLMKKSLLIPDDLKRLKKAYLI